MKPDPDILFINSMRNTSALLVLSACLLGSACSPQKNEPIFANEKGLPLIGALRWDGVWYPGSVQEGLLDAKKWRCRVPVYSQIVTNALGEEKVIFQSYSQEIMDKEIEHAKGALDYWSFMVRLGKPKYDIDTKDETYESLHWYLKSQHQNDINFCVMAHVGYMKADIAARMREMRTDDEVLENDKEPDVEDMMGLWKTEIVPELIQLFTKENYQKVLGDRPLVYLYQLDFHLLDHWGSLDKFKEALDYLREKTKQAGLGSPYIVPTTNLIALLNPNLSEGGSKVSLADMYRVLKVDAFSAYSAHRLKDVDYKLNLELPYTDMMKANQEWWTAGKEAGFALIPPLNTGIDDRPRAEAEQLLLSRGVKSVWKAGNWYIQPTMEELKSNLVNCIGFIRKNPETVPADALLIYAWNENIEGGWLTPTVTEGTARLDAIREVREHLK